MEMEFLRGNVVASRAIIKVFPSEGLYIASNVVNTME